MDSYLIPDFNGIALSFSPFRVMLSVSLSVMAFIMLFVLSSPTLSMDFKHEGILDFVRGMSINIPWFVCVCVCVMFRPTYMIYNIY